MMGVMGQGIRQKKFCGLPIFIAQIMEINFHKKQKFLRLMIIGMRLQTAQDCPCFYHLPNTNPRTRDVRDYINRQLTVQLAGLLS